MIKIHIKHKIFGRDGYKLLEIKEEVEEGSIIKVTGNSGVGKTSLFHIIAGLSKPNFGYIQTKNEIFLDTEKNINLPPQKRNTAFMFQQYALFPNMTLKENILFAQKDKNRPEIDRLLTAFDLKKLEHRFPSELSGGQQQRTAIARALVQKAEILLLDEPFSAVEEDMHNIIIEEISRFSCKNSATVFVVSHGSDKFKAMPFSVLHLH